MGIFGLGEEDTKPTKPVAKEDKQPDTKKADSTSGDQSDEAKEILKKMEAKKDAGDCAFC